MQRNNFPLDWLYISLACLSATKIFFEVKTKILPSSFTGQTLIQTFPKWPPESCR